MRFLPKLPAILILLILIAASAVAEPFQTTTNVDSLQKVLNSVLAVKDQFDNRKLAEIERLKASIHPNSTLERQYEGYQNLVNTYKSFIQDSAYKYCRKLNQCANLLGDPGKIH